MAREPRAFPELPRFRPFQIVCSSPEILVRVRGRGHDPPDRVVYARWRGATPAEDERLAAADLLADERAEHLMLLDLGRNDAGRVAEIGTVKVTEQFEIERYSHVMHIVSNVVGTLTGYDVIDVRRRLPGGHCPAR